MSNQTTLYPIDNLIINIFSTAIFGSLSLISYMILTIIFFIFVKRIKGPYLYACIIILTALLSLFYYFSLRNFKNFNIEDLDVKSKITLGMLVLYAISWLIFCGLLIFNKNFSTSIYLMPYIIYFVLLVTSYIITVNVMTN